MTSSNNGKHLGKYSCNHCMPPRIASRMCVAELKGWKSNRNPIGQPARPSDDTPRRTWASQSRRISSKPSPNIGMGTVRTGDAHQVLVLEWKPHNRVARRDAELGRCIKRMRATPPRCFRITYQHVFDIFHLQFKPTATNKRNGPT